MEQFVSFTVEKSLLENFDIVARHHRRHRKGQVAVLMETAVANLKRTHPELFDLAEK